jgi:hypothetical protein
MANVIDLASRMAEDERYAARRTERPSQGNGPCARHPTPIGCSNCRAATLPDNIHTAEGTASVTVLRPVCVADLRQVPAQTGAGPRRLKSIAVPPAALEPGC